MWINGPWLGKAWNVKTEDIAIIIKTDQNHAKKVKYQILKNETSWILQLSDRKPNLICLHVRVCSNPFCLPLCSYSVVPSPLIFYHRLSFHIHSHSVIAVWVTALTMQSSYHFYTWHVVGWIWIRLTNNEQEIHSIVAKQGFPHSDSRKCFVRWFPIPKSDKLLQSWSTLVHFSLLFCGCSWLQKPGVIIPCKLVRQLHSLTVWNSNWCQSNLPGPIKE